MPGLKKKRLAGLWKKDAGGRTILEGHVLPTDILDALSEVRNGDQKVTLTIWLNSDDEKRNADSPDASLILSEKWQKPEPSTDAKTVKEDIPF